MRCAIINLDTKTVVNVIDYGAVPVGCPPGMTGNLIAVADDSASIGWTWNGTVTTNPTPPIPLPPVTSVLSQDLMAQFTAADIASITAAVTGNSSFALLWYSLLAQRDPMIVSNARFLAGWTALVQVLGQPRMTAISLALGVTI